ncbi:MAG: GGDEF domain-containing protein [Fibrobacter sp.]|nr:GGDEF domain-containing protein [Fibrobacter sp.]
MIFERTIKYVLEQKKLEDTVFWGVLLLTFFSGIIACVLAIFENVGLGSIVFSFIALSIYICLGIIAKCTGRISACYFALCLVINVAVLPVLFFMCGGFDCGMILYCLMGIFLCSLYGHKKRRAFLIISTLVADVFSFSLAWAHPELLTPIDPVVKFYDTMISFVLLAISLYAVMAYFCAVYERERRKSKDLIKQLDYYSKRDPLTTLFNRRHFIKYLEQMIWPRRAGYYLLMYDIDNFKKVNDTYGHPFGDQVLCRVAEVALKEVRANVGECAVRYGGEEFIHLMYAESFDEAKVRAEQLRKAFENIKMEEQPDVCVTISGGIVDCMNPKFDHQNKMLSYVDSLLYLAKSNGKNQICSCK